MTPTYLIGRKKDWRLDAGSDLVDQALPAFLTLPLTPVGFFQHFHNLIVYNRREGWDVFLLWNTKALTKQVEDLIPGQIARRTLEHAIVVLVRVQHIPKGKF